MSITENTSTESIPQNTFLSRLRAIFDKYKTRIGLGVLILYVLLLGLGTIGEIWDVEWILDLPLFRPPGKY